MLKAAILDDYQNVALKLADWDRLKGKVDFTVFTDHLADLDAVAKRLADFEIVIMNRERTPFLADLLKKLPKLKLLLTSGMVNRSIDVRAANAQGITVCGSVSGSSSTPELTWGILIALARQIPREVRNLQEGRWQETVGVGLRGRTLGIIGLGHLGIPVARVGLAFDMKIAVWSPNMTQARADTVMPGLKAVSKDEMMAGSDFITIHMPLGPRSIGIVGAADIARMKPTAYLINTSRGPIVDQEALYAAVRAGKIAGCGLDVYDIEPLPKDHPVRSLPNSVLTPHLGFVEIDAYKRHFGEAVENIEAWMKGAPTRVIEPHKD
jgi:phosphoglycerate dehydrogenase-like enzyme